MFDFIRNLRKSDEEKWQDQINDYLENTLSPAARQQFEQKMAEDTALRVEIERRRLILDAMGKMPARPAPRNFTLTPEMVGVQKPAPVWYRQPTFRMVGALTAIMIVALFAFETLQPQNQTAEPAASVAQVEVEVTRLVTETVVEEGAQVEVTRVVQETMVEEVVVVVTVEVMAEEEVADADVAAFGATSAESDENAEVVAEPTGMPAQVTDDEQGESEMADEAMADSEMADDMMSDEMPPTAPENDGSANAIITTALPPATATARPAPRVPTDTPPAARADSTVVANNDIEESTENVVDPITTGGAERVDSVSNDDRGEENAGIFLPIAIAVILLLATGLWYWRKN